MVDLKIFERSCVRSEVYDGNLCKLYQNYTSCMKSRIFSDSATDAAFGIRPFGPRVRECAMCVCVCVCVCVDVKHAHALNE